MNFNQINLRMRTSFITVLGVILFFACQREEMPVKSEQQNPSISLVSPNGIRIANNLKDINNQTSEAHFDFFKSRKECNVESIVYEKVESGFVANVKYKTSDGESHTFLMGNAKVKFVGTKISYLSKAGGRTNDTGGGTWTVTCSGPSCCTPTFNLLTNQASCPCVQTANRVGASAVPEESCKMEVKQSN